MTDLSIEPCPWCNGKAFAEPPSLGRSHWTVVCDDCGAEGPRGHDDAMAARRWNERAEVTLRTTQDASGLAGDAIPRDIVEQVLSRGRAEWGATAEQTADAHIASFTETLRKTREHFNVEDVPVALHGLYLEGTETVLCHTGTSPNSAANAQALTGAWNWLHDQCAALIDAPAQEPQT